MKPFAQDSPITEAVARVRRGDLRAFDILMETFGPLLTAYLHKRVHNVHDREELFQDTFLQAYQQIGSLRKPDLFGPWLLAIARRNCSAHYRRQRKMPLAIETENEEDRVDSVPGRTVDSGDREIGDAILRSISELSSKLAIVVHLSLVEELSSADVARLLNLRESTVRMRLSRGLDRLRSKLSRKGIIANTSDAP